MGPRRTRLLARRLITERKRDETERPVLVRDLEVRFTLVMRGRRGSKWFCYIAVMLLLAGDLGERNR